jgi:hypothetical protein
MLPRGDSEYGGLDDVGLAWVQQGAKAAGCEQSVGDAVPKQVGWNYASPVQDGPFRKGLRQRFFSDRCVAHQYQV